MNRRSVAAILILLSTLAATARGAEDRGSIDFNIAKAERSLRAARNDVFRAAAHITLGDLLVGRSQTADADSHYSTALKLARAGATEARKDGNLRRYSEAVAYAGLAAAKRGHAAEAWDAFDEAMRYGSDWPHLWSLKTSAMLTLNLREKAMAAARSGAIVAEALVAKDESRSARLDLLTARYSLSSVLSGSAERAEQDEAVKLLESVIHDLRGTPFDALRREATRLESFETLSSSTTDVDSYVSLLHRSRIRLVRLYLETDRRAEARAELRKLLAERSDDPDVLALSAMIADDAGARATALGDALEANPFSFDLVRKYEVALAGRPVIVGNSTASDGEKVRAALQSYGQAAYERSLSLTRALLASYPANDTLLYLEARALHALGKTAEAAASLGRIKAARIRAAVNEIVVAGSAQPLLLRRGRDIADPTAAELRELLRSWSSLTSEQRVSLDGIEFSAAAQFDAGNSDAAVGTTVLISGRIDGVPFRFASPTTFRGEFALADPLRLQFRIASVSEEDSAAVLILEAIGVSR